MYFTIYVAKLMFYRIYEDLLLRTWWEGNLGCFSFIQKNILAYQCKDKLFIRCKYMLVIPYLCKVTVQ